MCAGRAINWPTAQKSKCPTCRQAVVGFYLMPEPIYETKDEEVLQCACKAVSHWLMIINNIEFDCSTVLTMKTAAIAELLLDARHDKQREVVLSVRIVMLILLHINYYCDHYSIQYFYFYIIISRKNMQKSCDVFIVPEELHGNILVISCSLCIWGVYDMFTCSSWIRLLKWNKTQFENFAAFPNYKKFFGLSFKKQKIRNWI